VVSYPLLYIRCIDSYCNTRCRGQDACGKSCSSAICKSTESCSVTLSTCVPRIVSCNDTYCSTHCSGQDRCGVQCSAAICTGSQQCQNGICTCVDNYCLTHCSGRDQCGNLCSSVICSSGQVCSTGTCVCSDSYCRTHCSGRDSCGVLCLATVCTSGQVCSAQGICVASACTDTYCNTRCSGTDKCSKPCSATICGAGTSCLASVCSICNVSPSLGNCLLGSVNSVARSKQFGNFLIPSPGVQIRATLIGPSTADFDLYIWIMGSGTQMFSLLVSGEGPTAIENVTVFAKTGSVIKFEVYAFGGSGNFTLQVTPKLTSL